MASYDARQKVLLIGGSVNQTSICHEISRHLKANCDCLFTPYYTDHPLATRILNTGLLDFTALGGEFLRQTKEYLSRNNLPIDYGGNLYDYDMVVTTSDLIIQNNIKNKRIILVQEGMTDPENLFFHMVKRFKLPPWMAMNTSAFGLSNAYDLFCVASEGYRKLFIRKGVDPKKIIVTGIPNFDNAVQLSENNFFYKDYVLVATSDLRETKRYDRRKAFIRKSLEIAGGRTLIFKLHPNENISRATQEIKAIAPHSIIFSEGNTGEMVANCSVLITQYSSVAFLGLALNKEVYSYFDIEELCRLMPVQNGGRSGSIIAKICLDLLQGNEVAM